VKRTNANTAVGRFKRVFSERELNRLGKEVRYCQRERVVTPFRLVMAMLSTLSSRKVETLADLQRGFNALFGESLAYKPFHNQLSKRGFGEFMGACVERLVEKLVLNVLKIKEGHAFSEFRRIVIQDGSSFAVKDSLRDVFPGRFKRVSPAAVELHVSMDLLSEALEHITLTPDTFGERAELPDPGSLSGCLLLADRGYFSLPYVGEMIKAGANFVLRTKTNLNPRVVNTYGKAGKRLRRWCGKSLQEVLERFPKKTPVDLDVCWHSAESHVSCRLVVSYHPKAREFRFLLTNLPRTRYAAEQIGLAYKLRWQIELLFKEWKSYANLHAFDTGKSEIAEGLIWAAIAAATVKRYLAHLTQQLAQVDISTRKVAMCAHHVTGALVEGLLDGRLFRIRRAINNAVAFLATNARRAHPQRDRRSGRLKLNLEPVFNAA
jgi:Transposase DDE domain